MQVVAGAGAIDHSQLVDLAGKSFADLPTDPTTADDLVKKVTSLHDQNHSRNMHRLYQARHAWLHDRQQCQHCRHNGMHKLFCACLTGRTCTLLLACDVQCSYTYQYPRTETPRR